MNCFINVSSAIMHGGHYYHNDFIENNIVQKQADFMLFHCCSTWNRALIFFCLLNALHKETRHSV